MVSDFLKKVFFKRLYGFLYSGGVLTLIFEMTLCPNFLVGIYTKFKRKVFTSHMSFAISENEKEFKILYIVYVF